MMAIEYEALFQKFLPALISKRNEFIMQGYKTVTVEDIWDVCVKKKWRKRNVQTLRPYEMVEDLFSLSTAQYMTYTQIKESKTSNWFSELNQDELQLLLHGNGSEEP
ncbi:post-transcriptional regulator [Viridibacillus arvi]|nr:post-transcriptional regulator [Viridibacillus arvi]